MSWFILMEMMLVAIMTVYLAYHTRLVFAKARYRNTITVIIVLCLIILCLYELIFFGFLVNACICFVVFDIINLVLYKTKFNHYFKFIYCQGMVALAASIVLSCYGMYNAKNTVITTYNVEIDKDFNDKSLMVISDIHLGTIVSKTDLTKISNHAGTIDPDAIILLGDIFDENTTQDEVDYAMEVFSNLASKYSVFFIEGNHEIGFQGGSPLKEFNLINRLKDSGVDVLLDEKVMLDDIYLIGRKDYVIKKRKSLEAITSDIKDNKPLVLLDHQPKNYKENAKLGIDLQISGHTHAGQIFPLNYFFELINVNDMNYGIKKEGNFHAVVSSGMGGWGYSIRTAGHSEIVVINLSSKHKK